MTTLTAGYRSVSFLINLNWDRLLYIATIAASLYGSALIASFFVQ